MHKPLLYVAENVQTAYLPCYVTKQEQYPLRLPKSLKAGAAARAQLEGVSLNTFVLLAIAEKLERLHTQ
jgi:predicted HicB family RNase H-like nuclease